MMVRYFSTYLLLFLSGAIASKRTQITQFNRRAEVIEAYESSHYVTPHELINHVHSLSKVVGTPSPYKIPGYSPAMGRKIHRHLTEKHPDLVNHIVNLGHHYKDADLTKGRRLSKREIIPDVARRLQDEHINRIRIREEVDIAGDEELEIGTCPAVQGCEHDPCVKDYLVDPYGDFSPAYGGGPPYEAALIGLVRPLQWTGAFEDRTSAEGYAVVLIALQAAKLAVITADQICDGVDDEINICLLVVALEVPNPFKIACSIAVAVLATTELTLSAFKEAMDFQDGIVQGAEIEASYEHSRKLLHMQCALYDETRCRCSESLAEDGYGLGCDGLDSDCDDEIDECDEDMISPTIDVTKAMKRCGGTFANLDEAKACVLESVDVTDDCQAVEVTAVATGECDSALVTVTAQEKLCNKTTTATVPVFVDGTVPLVTCGFGSVEKVVENSKFPVDVGFGYSASDNCGKPIDVTVDIYASEMEEYKTQKMAIFFLNNNMNNAAELYLDASVCASEGGGQCIKDATALDARLYTAVVSATDSANNKNKFECQMTVVPKGKLDGKAVDTSNSTQRFLLSSYSSTWG